MTLNQLKEEYSDKELYRALDGILHSEIAEEMLLKKDRLLKFKEDLTLQMVLYEWLDEKKKEEMVKDRKVMTVEELEKEYTNNELYDAFRATKDEVFAKSLLLQNSRLYRFTIDLFLQDTLKKWLETKRGEIAQDEVELLFKWKEQFKGINIK